MIFLSKINKVKKLTTQLYHNLSDKLENGIIMRNNSHSMNIHIEYPDSDINISVAIPLDTYISYGIVYEIALQDTNGIVYIKEIGYEDVQQFSTETELIEEIYRIQNKLDV